MTVDTAARSLASVAAADFRWQGKARPPGGTLTLRRAWPRSASHMIAEFLAPDAQLVAGQWLSDAPAAHDTLEALLRLCPNATVGSAAWAGGLLILHAGGADNRMPVLAEWASRPGATLLVHRPTRRAVLRLPHAGQDSYAKIVPAKSCKPLAAAAALVPLLRSTAFDTARLIHSECTPAGGVLVWSALPGVGLHTLIGTAEYAPAALAAGRALRALHGLSIPSDLPAYDADAAIAELHRWTTRTAAFDSSLAARVAHLAQGAAQRLSLMAPPAQLSLIHRDFHEKQVMVGTGGRVGMIDFDTLSRGDPAVDLGNFLAHILLRRLQGRASDSLALAAAESFLAGYQPDPATTARALAYQELSSLRLACVYAFRDADQSIPDALLEQARSQG